MPARPRRIAITNDNRWGMTPGSIRASHRIPMELTIEVNNVSESLKARMGPVPREMNTIWRRVPISLCVYEPLWRRGMFRATAYHKQRLARAIKWLPADDHE